MADAKAKGFQIDVPGEWPMPDDAPPLLIAAGVQAQTRYVSDRTIVELRRGPSTEYLILRSSHSFTAELFRSAAESQAGRDVHSEFEFLESKTPYRSPFRTPKPRIHGVQTAKVVGKEGEEIDVDVAPEGDRLEFKVPSGLPKA